MALRRAGVSVALAPTSGRLQPGCDGRRHPVAAWMPMPDLAAVVVIDEHDERFKEERTPAWHAREVALERARRAVVPAVMTSRCRRSRRSVPARSCVVTDRSNAMTGRSSTCSTDATRIRPSRVRSPPIFDATSTVIGEWCASSTARVGLVCSPARRAVSWSAATTVVRSCGWSTTNS